MGHLQRVDFVIDDKSLHKTSCIQWFCSAAESRQNIHTIQFRGQMRTKVSSLHCNLEAGEGSTVSNESV